VRLSRDAAASALPCSRRRDGGNHGPYPPLKRLPSGDPAQPVDAENSVTSCDLRIFMDQAAEDLPALYPRRHKVGDRGSDNVASVWWPQVSVGFHNPAVASELRLCGWLPMIMLPAGTR
jgi:hypothetical protein